MNYEGKIYRPWPEANSLKRKFPEYKEHFLQRIDHAISSHPVNSEEVLNTFSW